MSIRLDILTLLAMTCACSAQTVRDRLKDPKFHLYSVIFGVTVGANSTIATFRVSKVFEPRSGNADAVKLEVPQVYIDAARKKAETKKFGQNLKDGKPVEFFTYFLYTPTEPALVITDVDLPLDKQP
jgi:hypothetical protein